MIHAQMRRDVAHLREDYKCHSLDYTFPTARVSKYTQYIHLNDVRICGPIININSTLVNVNPSRNKVA